jgi:hypothetical protein
MSTPFNRFGLEGLSSYVYRSFWDGEILERTALALYRYRRPIQAQIIHLYDLGPWTVESFFDWAREFLDAALPDGPELPVDQAAAGKVCHRLKNDAGTMYFGLEEQRWPLVGWWYEQVAHNILEEVLD